MSAEKTRSRFDPDSFPGLDDLTRTRQFDDTVRSCLPYSGRIRLLEVVSTRQSAMQRARSGLFRFTCTHSPYAYFDRFIFRTND